MASADIIVEDVSSLYTSIFCQVSVCTLLVYDWLLCLDEEVLFMWNWRSAVTVSSVMYAFSRYGIIVENFLPIATIYPICIANSWAQTAIEILSLFTFSAFSALRAYALSNRNIWLAAVIVALALPPTSMRIIQTFYQGSVVLPSPFNCSSWSSESPTLSMSVVGVARASQIAAEVLVIGITWWYSYQSYRIRKSVELGKTISSLLVYNGSIYFLFLATLYTLDISLSTPSASEAVQRAGPYLETFVDPITSILVSRFVLSLRGFDSAVASAPDFDIDCPVRERTAESTILQFGAQPSESLPGFLASFAHPVHTDSISVLDPESEEAHDSGSERREADVVSSSLVPEILFPETSEGQPTRLKLVV